MLNEAYKKLPETGVKKVASRFKIPQVQMFYQGKSKTIFVNFKEISEYLNRDPNIIRKFLARELATPATPSNGRLILHTHLDPQTLQNAVTFFIKRYVKCPVCEGYDTKLRKKEKALLIKCEICGAESPVPPIK
jgi:translation initiation factor 2 subunit 2